MTLGYERAPISIDMTNGWNDALFTFFKEGDTVTPNYSEMLKVPRRVIINSGKSRSLQSNQIKISL